MTLARRCRPDGGEAGITLRLLLLAFLFSVVVVLFSTPTSQAAGFQVGHSEVQQSAPTALLWHYDEAYNFSTDGSSRLAHATAASGVSTAAVAAAGAHAPSVARTDAADTIDLAGNTGTGISDAARAADSLHGNSLLSAKPTSLYAMTDNTTGDVMKWGITSNPAGRYSAAWLARNNVTMQILDQGSRWDMRAAEQWLEEFAPGPWTGATPK